MKLIALFAAGAVALGTLAAPVPAEAQRHGYGVHRGYAYGHGYRGRSHYVSRSYHRGHRYARSRTVCRVQRGRYGPVRRCFRVYR